MKNRFDIFYSKNYKIPHNPDTRELAYAILNRIALNAKNSTWGENNVAAQEELFVDYYDDLMADIIDVLEYR